MHKVYLGIILFFPFALAAQKVDSIDNLTFRIGKEWEVKKEATFTLLTYFDNPKTSFCQLAVYAALPSTKDKKQDFQTEWAELIEKNFTVFTLAQPATMKTKFGTSFQRLGAKATDKNGNSYYVQLNVFDCGNYYQSIVAVSTNQKQLQAYDSLWQGLITRISKDKSGSTQSTVTNSGSSNTPDVKGLPPADKIFITKWGKSEIPIGAYSNNDMLVNLAYSGYKRCEYDFRPDGTYTFQGENWGGKVNHQKFRLKDDKEYGLIDETGTFRVNGNQLILTPTKNVYRIVEKNGTIKRTETLGLEKRMYQWQTYYAIGMEESRLVLTTAKTNEIDGDFSTYEPAVSFPNSYCYVLGKKMFFTFLPLALTTPSTAPSANTVTSKELVGTWGKSASSPSQYTNGVLTNLSYSGYTKGEYNFKADGTYNFQGESWGGYMNSTDYRLIDESGTYSVSGNKLSITPASSLYRVVDREGKLKKSENIPLTKRNYTWQRHYYEGIQENALILTTNVENPIDGGFSSNSLFQNSFIYSPGKRMEFKFLPLK